MNFLMDVHTKVFSFLFFFVKGFLVFQFNKLIYKCFIQGTIKIFDLIIMSQEEKVARSNLKKIWLSTRTSGKFRL